MDFFWEVFEKSGSIEAYLAYKEEQRQALKKEEKVPYVVSDRRRDISNF